MDKRMKTVMVNLSGNRKAQMTAVNKLDAEKLYS